MTEIINNHLVLEIENNENSKVFNCLKCNKKMFKKLLNNMICSSCLLILKKEDAEQKKLQKKLDKEE
jgi:hypothetical protein